MFVSLFSISAETDGTSDGDSLDESSESSSPQLKVSIKTDTHTIRPIRDILIFIVLKPSFNKLLAETFLIYMVEVK